MQCFPGTTGISVPWIDFTPSTRQGEEVAQRTKCQSLESVLGLPACTLSHPTEPWGAPDLSSTDKGQVCPRISTALRHQRGTHPHLSPQHSQAPGQALVTLTSRNILATDSRPGLQLRCSSISPTPPQTHGQPHSHHPPASVVSLGVPLPAQ